jgi:release factor glutamine methyltransferase
VVDLCCGSGALGVALAAMVDRVDLYAADVDPVAVACARRNVATVGGQAFEGDLDAPLPQALRGRVDLLVANVPYVPTEAIALMPPEARLHEARVALDGGTDGLAIMRRLSGAAPRWLAPGGHLLVETSGRQAPRAVAVMAGDGLDARVVTSDEWDATIVVGTRRAVRTSRT